MKNLLILFLLIFYFSTYSQEKTVEDIEFIETAEKTLDDISNEIPFAVIENVPVYKGCDDSMTNTELKNCMSTSISKHVAKNFNTKIANGLGFPDGKVRINLIFKIDREGNVVDIRSRAPHKALENEAIRVIKLIPRMDKPGYQKGKPVTVPYSLPIVFNIQNPKKSSKK
ncbi:TonB-like protein [Mariniflexile fucanivorans]|uniref:TonB-like protein n=1 Tax=Mariniflexile fucanivorans TaxID=264023 RepID=A0A4R1RIQ5_9FLAO|nr:energy transducer TonB [Mariniflexile fucanivorans]TCL65532.1 TonB-like protein [Mariniflexile fucanivorans]